MKILLITGQLAKGLVERYAKESHVDYDVVALPSPVAALLTAKAVAEALREIAPKGYDAILTPGFIFGDVWRIEQVTRIPTFKGPRYAADLPVVLDLYENVKLSKVVPACELLKEELRERALGELESSEKNRDELLKKPGNMLVGALPVGKDFPMRVIAEIVDVPFLSDEQIAERARYYVHSGADIVDIGMTVGGGREQDARRAVKTAKEAIKVPISIDTMDPAEARAGVQAGADVVLSVDAGNAESMSDFASQVAVVVIPTNYEKGYFPKDSGKRVDMMKGNIKTVRSLGMNRILADLILDPIGSPGFVESIVSYHKFRVAEPELPLFAGIGNVSELLDADTPGVNALAAGVASELGINLLLTTEVSNVCKGCVKELSMASRMMFLARRRGCIPKSLGIDLLFLKEKRFLEEPFNPGYVEGARQVQRSTRQQLQMDPKGCFKIMIDRGAGQMVAIHYPMGKREKADFVARGQTAIEIYSSIIDLSLVSNLKHSAYLGYELGKAEIALRTGKSYVQDSVMFS